MHPTLAAMWIKARQQEFVAEARQARRIQQAAAHPGPMRRVTGQVLIRLGNRLAGEAHPVTAQLRSSLSQSRPAMNSLGG